MGCGSSTAAADGGAAPGQPGAKAKEVEPVVAFVVDDAEDEEDGIDITQGGVAPNGRNPKSAIAYAKNPTAEETEASIARSLQINASVTNEVGAFEPDEQSPAPSPRKDAAGRTDPSALLKKYTQQEDVQPVEKKHYFPDSSPTWDSKIDDSKDRTPVWSTAADKSDGDKKRDPLFPSIAVRQPVQRASSDGDLSKANGGAHLPSIYGTDGKPEPVQLAIVALEQKKMREEHEKNMGSLAYIQNYRTGAGAGSSTNISAD